LALNWASGKAIVTRAQLINTMQSDFKYVARR
jgi:hypothetical protein